MSDAAMTIVGQIMFELTNWLNNTPQAEFEIREKDYFRWLDNSRRLSSFSEPDVKLFKQKFDELIYSLRPQKVLFWGTLYVCSTDTVRRYFTELSNIEMNSI